MGLAASNQPVVRGGVWETFWQTGSGNQESVETAVTSGAIAGTDRYSQKPSKHSIQEDCPEEIHDPVMAKHRDCNMTPQSVSFHETIIMTTFVTVHCMTCGIRHNVTIRVRNCTFGSQKS
jgi:hypothetical protein